MSQQDNPHIQFGYPNHELEDGLRESVDWFRAAHDRRKRMGTTLLFTQFHIARATTLGATGEFNPGTYLAGPEAVELFIVTRILLWGVTLFGLFLVAWGIWEQHLDQDR